MLRVIFDYTYEDLENLTHIVVCLYDDRAFNVFAAEFQRSVEELQGE